MPPTDDSNVSDDFKDEYSAEPDETATNYNELPNTNDEAQVTSRNSSTRYNLPAQPAPRTYRDFLVHELQVKPVLQNFLQNNKTN